MRRLSASPPRRMGALRVVNLTRELAPQCAALELAAFPSTDPSVLISEADMRAYADTFPGGFFVVLDGDRAIAQGAGIYVDFDFDHPQHTIAEVTGTHQCGHHDPAGAWYYGTDIVVHPDYRRRGIGRWLYDLRKELVVRDRKRGIIAGGYLAGFHEHKHALTAEQYCRAVVAGTIYDSTLTMQLENGFEVRGVLANYLADTRNDGWASLIVWENPQFGG
ncbi:MAG: GNAT family N-acetyltransferase [Myxococcales bacterium]|nr:GNAT family N-acetyltransferase [Myxococcales bacterium]